MIEQEKAKKLLPIIQAIAEGKKIQYSFNGVTWFDRDEDFELQVICNNIISGSIDYRIKPEENYTIEQNCGDNRVEGDVLSVSGSVSEKKYRPFKDCSELIMITGTKLLWVINKDSKVEFLINGYDNDCREVKVGNCWITLKVLFRQYEFCDHSPCGVEE